MHVYACLCDCNLNVIEFFLETSAFVFFLETCRINKSITAFATRSCANSDFISSSSFKQGGKNKGNTTSSMLYKLTCSKVTSPSVANMCSLFRFGLGSSTVEIQKLEVPKAGRESTSAGHELHSLLAVHKISTHADFNSFVSTSCKFAPSAVLWKSSTATHKL